VAATPRRPAARFAMLSALEPAAESGGFCPQKENLCVLCASAVRWHGCRHGAHAISENFIPMNLVFFHRSRGVNNFFSAAHFRQIQISGACASTPFYPYLILTQSFVGILANFSRFGLKNRHRFYTRIRRASGGLIARKPPPVARFKLIALQRIFCFFLVACPQPVCYFHARRWVETLRATARWLGH
jgi:hypothetical protein